MFIWEAWGACRHFQQGLSPVPNGTFYIESLEVWKCPSEYRVAFVPGPIKYRDAGMWSL